METKRKFTFHFGELTDICGTIQENEDGDSCMLEVKLDEIEDTWCYGCNFDVVPAGGRTIKAH